MFFTYLRRELRRRRRQALVIALGLALGIGLVITVTSVSTGMRQAQDEVLHSLYGVGTDITVSQEPTPPGEGEQGQGGGPGRFEFGQDEGTEEGDSAVRDRLTPAMGQSVMEGSTVQTVAGLDGVSAATGALNLTNVRVSGDFSGFADRVQGGDGQPAAPPSDNTEQGQGPGAAIDVESFTVTGVDPAVSGIGPLSSTEITEGRALTEDDADAAVALLDSGYAAEQELAVDGTITVGGEDFTIVGIATADGGASSSNVYIPLAKAQALAEQEDAVTTVYVKATDATRIPAVKSAIAEALPDATVTDASDLAEQVSGSLSSASELAGSLGRWVSVAVLIAAFAVASLLTVSAVTRRVREFGTLKALGWRSRRVIGQVMGESLVQGVLGGLLGIALGLGGAALVGALSPTLSASVAPSTITGPGGMRGGMGGPGGGMRQIAEQATQTVQVQLTAPVSPQVIALAVALAVSGGLIAGLLGGWRASRLRPADALRRVE
ncbi:ABC transporter permease [Allostreptomyces psammosilenae]|uniref:ABC-type lipoprotein release transport system permease subunit n=1 Tax=Allostreptomyces psammosilenae TaxID=1892865 RepID=A0A853A1X0_9ACTN|nr:ABC transporter permease [Allostreptomyces psammosilenae]NYI08379.1 ABC-type lipoprotein release transport system permease subunit [Allostreptomyces psammosilenae]